MDRRPGAAYPRKAPRSDCGRLLQRSPVAAVRAGRERTRQPRAGEPAYGQRLDVDRLVLADPPRRERVEVIALRVGDPCV